MRLKLMTQLLTLQIQVLLLQVQILRKKLERELGLFKVAQASLGVDISPLDAVSDDLGCAESVSWIIRKVISDFPIITGTWTLNKKLSEDLRFERVYYYHPGTIIISPTGSGNGKIPGHVGICGEGQDIMSADSFDGVFKLNFTQNTWRSRYGQLGGMPIYYYRLIIK